MTGFYPKKKKPLSGLKQGCTFKEKICKNLNVKKEDLQHERLAKPEAGDE